MTRVRQVKASEPPRHARRNEGELGRKVAEEVPLTALPLASLVGVCFLSMTLSQRVSPAAMSTVHETVQIRLAVGFRLDSLWAETMGIDPSDTKERPLRLVAELLNRAGVAYALIGGVAVQIHTTEPRTTLDIDVAVPRFTDVPRAELLAAGFDHTGRHEHSDNWHAPPAGPGSLRTTVQFSAEDVGIADAVSHAELTDLADGLRMRVAVPADLIVLKLAAASEPRRRPSKRQHDLADVVALMEEYPALRTTETLARLRDVRLSLQALDEG